MRLRIYLRLNWNSLVIVSFRIYSTMDGLMTIVLITCSFFSLNRLIMIYDVKTQGSTHE